MCSLKKRFSKRFEVMAFECNWVKSRGRIVGLSEKSIQTQMERDIVDIVDTLQIWDGTSDDSATSSCYKYDEAWRSGRMKMWTSPYFSGGDGTGVLWVSVSGAWQSIRHGVVLCQNHCVKRKLRFQNGSRWHFRVNHSMSKCFIHCPFSEWVSQRVPCILRKSSIKSTNLITSTS